MLSVIICAHNPRRDYFQRCIAGLQNQTLLHQEWNLLLVDNRSDQPLSGEIDLSWHPDAAIVREETPGLTAARLRGIRESTGSLLVFVDDDNVLDPNFLAVAQRTMEERLFLGAWSGQCRPAFETPPADWTRRYWGNLVIREFERDIWSNLPRLPDSMPCGAGLCVRREVALHYLDLHESGKRPFSFDRNGKSLLSGGDNDLAACACDIGLGVGLITSLRLTHLISPERLTEEYLVRLCEGIFCSAVVLDHFRSAAGAADLYKIRWYEQVRALLSRGPHRKIQMACLRGRRRGLELIASLN
jgi:hypothetical protein